MDNTIIIALIAGLALLLVLFMVISASKNKEEKKVPNYRALFILSLSWLPIGIAIKNPGLWGMGIVFLIVGLVNKEKWGKETKWADLSPKVKKIKIIFVGGLTILLLAAIAFFIFSKGN